MDSYQVGYPTLPAALVGIASSLNGPNPDYLLVFLPMAMESASTRDALLAWSASHLALCHSTFEPLALQARTRALSSLSKSLTEDRSQHEQALAACLALCSMEAILGDIRNWYDHLVGAAVLIQHASGDTNAQQQGIAAIGSTFEGRWLLRNFAYHDILMSVSMNRAPFIPGTYWIAEDESLADSYFGLATTPMKAISEISTLNAKLSTLDPTTAALNGDVVWSQVVEQLNKIETDLVNWTCPPADDISLVQLAETYRNAALIHLYRVSRAHNIEYQEMLQVKISNQVKATILAVQQMPAECLPECTLLFPLFMAGGEASTDEQTAFIRKRLNDMERFRRFENVAKALDILEELWRTNDIIIKIEAEPGQSLPARKKDWLDILAQRNWKLAIS